MKNCLLFLLLLSSIAYGNEALTEAVQNGDLKEVKSLIKNGADINTLNEEGETV